jgi:SAM-dependent methyltransferase
LEKTQELFQKMSEERFHSTPVKVLRFLTSGSCSKNPMNERVNLHLYQIEFTQSPVLDNVFYTDARWMYLNEYQEKSKDLPCGLCTRLWSEYALRHKMAQNQLTWDNIEPYQKLIEDTSHDSHYLRHYGLKPILKALLPLDPKKVLDVGSGTGWFAKETGLNTYQCDVAPRPGAIRFAVGQITSLPYQDAQFDLVVASMVLCWEEDLDKAAKELARITIDSGNLIIALPHPMFYQTGKVRDDDTYLITENYNDSRSINDLYIGEKAGPFAYFHRPLHCYLNILANSGFQLVEMREWSIDKDHYLETMKEKARKKTFLLPTFLFLKMKRNRRNHG